MFYKLSLFGQTEGVSLFEEEIEEFICSQYKI